MTCRKRFGDKVVGVYLAQRICIFVYRSSVLVAKIASRRKAEAFQACWPGAVIRCMRSYLQAQCLAQARRNLRKFMRLSCHALCMYACHGLNIGYLIQKRYTSTS